MAKPNSRDTLIDYAKRRLGEPVLEINVDEDQLEDRVDEAIEYFQEYHSDATKTVYLKHQVTADDITNGYIPIPSDYIFVKRVLPINGGNSSSGMFSLGYQLRLNDLAVMGRFMGDMAYYTMMQQHISMIESKLNGLPQVNFSQYEGKLYIHGEFETQDVIVGQYIIVEATQLVDPATNTSVYNDKWLKQYTTALIKQQWGQNLSKFEGMQLPGGVTMNGMVILEAANAEVLKLEEDIRMEHELPVEFFVG